MTDITHLVEAQGKAYWVEDASSGMGIRITHAGGLFADEGVIIHRRVWPQLVAAVEQITKLQHVEAGGRAYLVEASDNTQWIRITQASGLLTGESVKIHRRAWPYIVAAAEQILGSTTEQARHDAAA